MKETSMILVSMRIIEYTYKSLDFELLPSIKFYQYFNLQSRR